jgi:hypothetical protein
MKANKLSTKNINGALYTQRSIRLLGATQILTIVKPAKGKGYVVVNL